MITSFRKNISIISVLILSHTYCFSQTIYKIYQEDKFSIQLPNGFILEDMFPVDYNSPDFDPEGPQLDQSNFIVKLSDGHKVSEINSLNNSRFDASTIQEFYNAAVKGSKLNISYKIQKNNWFVISGTNKEKNTIVYWKRVLGENFVSDLYIEYTSDKKDLIEPYIGTISKSFTSELKFIL